MAACPSCWSTYVYLHVLYKASPSVTVPRFSSDTVDGREGADLRFKTPPFIAFTLIFTEAIMLDDHRQILVLNISKPGYVGPEVHLSYVLPSMRSLNASVS